MIKENIKTGFAILTNPEKEFSKVGKITLENITAYYTVLLLVMSLVASLVNFLFFLLKAIYYNLTINLDVNYWKLINYSIGSSTSIIFLYIFIGTFIFMILSLILNPFFKKLSYANILKIMMYALSPLLLFGWIKFSVFALFIWSICLFVIGIKTSKNTKIRKNSIEQRY